MLGRLLGLALRDRVPEDSVADYVAACRAAIVAAVFATTVAWWNLGLPRLVFSPEQMSDSFPSISTQLPIASDAM